MQFQEDLISSQMVIFLLFSFFMLDLFQPKRTDTHPITDHWWGNSWTRAHPGWGCRPPGRILDPRNPWTSWSLSGGSDLSLRRTLGLLRSQRAIHWSLCGRTQKLRNALHRIVQVHLKTMYGYIIGLIVVIQSHLLSLMVWPKVLKILMMEFRNRFQPNLLNFS